MKENGCCVEWARARECHKKYAVHCVRFDMPDDRGGSINYYDSTGLSGCFGWMSLFDCFIITIHTNCCFTHIFVYSYFRRSFFSRYFCIIWSLSVLSLPSFWPIRHFFHFCRLNSQIDRVLALGTTHKKNHFHCVCGFHSHFTSTS